MVKEQDQEGKIDVNKRKKRKKVNLYEDSKQILQEITNHMQKYKPGYEVGNKSLSFFATG